MNKILWGLLGVVLFCPAASAQRFSGAGEFGFGDVSVFSDPPARWSAGFGYSMQWYADVTVSGTASITFHQLQARYSGPTLKSGGGDQWREMDLRLLADYAPVTVPLFPTIDPTILVCGFFPHPNIAALSGEFRSVEFSGSFDGRLSITNPIYQNRLFVKLGESLQLGSTDSTLAIYGGNLYGGERLQLTPSFPSQITAGLGSVRIQAQTHPGWWLTLHRVSSLPGDFNYKGSVDAADYVLYRNSPNSYDYDLWRANFGNASSPGLSTAVSEPGTWWSFIVTTCCALRIGRARLRCVYFVRHEQEKKACHSLVTASSSTFHSLSSCCEQAGKS
jgi:hypothetical protein